MNHSSSSLQVVLPCDSEPDAISVLILFSVNNSYRLSAPEDMVQQFNHFFNVKQKNSNLGLITQASALVSIMIHVTTSNWLTEVGSSKLYSATTKREPTLFLLSGLFVISDLSLLLHLFLLQRCCGSFYASLSFAPWNQIWTISWHGGLKTKLYKTTWLPSYSLTTKKQPLHSF